MVDTDTPKGREQFMRLGVRYMPVVAKGERYVLAKNLDVLAEFLGVDRGAVHIPLPPQVLFNKWMTILAAAKRYVRQLPHENMNLLASPHNYGRTMRLLGHHVFQIGDAYLRCTLRGAKSTDDFIQLPLAAGTFADSEEIIRYGDEIIGNIERWWNELADKSCRRKLELSDYGNISVHQLLERCAWHSAHHTRQFADAVERLGIELDGRLTKEDLDGLPLPKGIWD